MLKIRYYYNPIIQKDDDGTMFINLYLTNGNKSKKFTMYGNNCRDLLTKVQVYLGEENRKIESSLYNWLSAWIRLHINKINKI